MLNKRNKDRIASYLAWRTKGIKHLVKFQYLFGYLISLLPSIYKGNKDGCGRLITKMSLILPSSLWLCPLHWRFAAHPPEMWKPFSHPLNMGCSWDLLCPIVEVVVSQIWAQASTWTWQKPRLAHWMVRAPTEQSHVAKPYRLRPCWISQPPTRLLADHKCLNEPSQDSEDPQQQNHPANHRVAACHYSYFVCSFIVTIDNWHSYLSCKAENMAYELCPY